MYTLESNLTGQPIISLQTGQAVAWIGEPLLTITALQVIAFTCRVAPRSQAFLLMTRDIRQFAADCVIIDDEDDLTDPADIVRLKADLKDRYSPLGQSVIADTGRRLGSVEDYSINLDTNRVQKLHIRRPLFWGWFSPNLIIDRTQIVDITPSHITVRDTTVQDALLNTDSLPETQP
ncbi:MAG TPA: PRC-barrel domain-containing protein [Candidatus Saccharimonadia bacterium]|nr:PRC-barrel domain-containing protein [Candidatus Saccharimonadia bacterium]